MLTAAPITMTLGAEDSDPAAPAYAGTPRMRRKGWRRRVGRELRLFAPAIALACSFVAATLTLGWVAGVSRAGAYSLTMSSSSTSNVSAAPPGMVGGAPRSP